MNEFKAGHYINQKGYKAFIPSLINRNFDITDIKIIILLEKAGRLLGELNAYSRNLPNIDWFLLVLAMDEATTSNKIEGTQTTINEAVLPEEEVSPERRSDRAEVINYLFALDYAVGRLTGKTGQILKVKSFEQSIDKLPICTRLIKETHFKLLQNARGEKKQPGKIRRSQNWIGGHMPSTAHFVPPPQEEVEKLLSDLEKFWNNPDLDVPLLVKIAISHYQFETIHPFLDGNGRMGRLLIVLQLLDSGILDWPTLYLSKYFERDRKLYYNALSHVREYNDIQQWIRYFLQGVCDTAQDTINKLEKIDKLRKDCEEKIRSLGRRSESAYKILELMYSEIYIKVDDVARHLDTTYQTANSLVKTFVEIGMLKTSSKKKNRMFVFKEYLDIFENKD